ncbi:MAG TPA: hypothetical protein VFB72_15905 [Verrucomicrobiae bacterium]|nr:hypothetical protein [Verrucomicrobiae bacterium]
MKVLFYCLTPLALAQDDLQSQIIGTKEALEQLGVEVEFLRWYDGSQKGDILHFFGRMPIEMFQQAREKRMKIVIADDLTEQTSLSAAELRLQQMAIRFLEKAAPSLSAGIYNWPVYRKADACIVSTTREAQLMNELFRVPKENVHVISCGARESMTWTDTAKKLKALYEDLLSSSR